jgi:hypothetical protein
MFLSSQNIANNLHDNLSIYYLIQSTFRDKTIYTDKNKLKFKIIL